MLNMLDCPDTKMYVYREEAPKFRDGTATLEDYKKACHFL